MTPHFYQKKKMNEAQSDRHKGAKQGAAIVGVLHDLQRKNNLPADGGMETLPGGTAKDTGLEVPTLGGQVDPEDGSGTPHIPG